MRGLLLAAGVLFGITVVIPWRLGARVTFSWDTMLAASGWFERLWGPFLLLGAVACLAAGFVLHGRSRTAVAAAVGAVGFALWFFVDTPSSLSMWEGRWQLVVFVLGLAAIPIGILAGRQVVAAVGALAVAAAMLAPIQIRGEERLFMQALLDGVRNPHKLMWQETTVLLLWLVLAFCAAGTLVLWAARSRAIERGVAATVMLWPAAMALFTGILHMALETGNLGLVLRLPLA